MDAQLERNVRIPIADLHFRPVIPNPGKIICVGLNFVAHIEETKRQESDYPVFFTKFANSLIGAYDPIFKPPETTAMDYEGELAIVIGATCRRVAPAGAFRHIAGYTIANDTSMRDYQYKTHQWLQGKAWESSTPLGPHLVTPDEVGLIKNLTLRTTLNGEQMQESSLELMIFDVPTLVSTISEFTTLNPGDVILAGTPSGVGSRRDPPIALNDGDVVAVEIDRIGRIENRVVAETVE
jgi:acylpyruvate hydrolase